jgi:hypothetical protein
MSSACFDGLRAVCLLFQWTVRIPAAPARASAWPAPASAARGGRGRGARTERRPSPLVCPRVPPAAPTTPARAAVFVTRATQAPTVPKVR